MTREEELERELAKEKEKSLAILLLAKDFISDRIREIKGVNNS